MYLGEMRLSLFSVGIGFSFFDNYVPRRDALAGREARTKICFVRRVQAWLTKSGNAYVSLLKEACRKRSPAITAHHNRVQGVRSLPGGFRGRAGP